MDNFKNYFKFPLHMWENFTLKVFTAENKMAFDWLSNFSLETKNKIIAIINGESKTKIANKSKFYHKNDGIVYCKILEGEKEGSEYKMFRMRGWGMLTGVGGYNLDAEYAAKIQDEFMEYCIKMLNNN